MAILNKKHINELLLKPSGKLRASIYIPTHPTSTPEAVTTSRTLLKNALQDIRNHPDFNERELGDVVDAVHKELYDNAEFWNYQSYGLAVLISNNGYEFYHLPFKVVEQNYISDNYIIHPLLVALSVDPSFFLLDVNTTKPRLFQAKDGRLELIAEDVLPGSLDEEVGRDEYKPELQHQSGGSSGFHGHTTSAAADEDLRRYLKILAEATDTALSHTDRPLILAGTVNRLSDFSKNLHYAHVLEETVDGNHESTHPDELIDLANPVIRHYLRDQRNKEVEKINELGPEHVASIMSDINAAAKEGRVDTLFLPIYRIDANSSQPDAEHSRIIDMPNDIEEIETLAAQTLQHGGNIIAVTEDTLSEIKALLRY